MVAGDGIFFRPQVSVDFIGDRRRLILLATSSGVLRLVLADSGGLGWQHATVLDYVGSRRWWISSLTGCSGFRRRRRTSVDYVGSRQKWIMSAAGNNGICWWRAVLDTSGSWLLVSGGERWNSLPVAILYLLIRCVTNIIPEIYTNHHIFIINFYLNRINKIKKGLLHLKLVLKNCDSWIDLNILWFLILHNVSHIFVKHRSS